ncbi:hypothetical protein ACRALDRAFT_1083457 [Sodiomyces alcalophilus JCM 7366]|uniref:uncharacterized protein n=1 Tax=Sodiomyces alcalophilus JCM 7366 TaxID=591952 RepID=UPI0039B3A294
MSHTMPGFGGGGGGRGRAAYVDSATAPGPPPAAGERGYRRRKIAAMANNVYRASASAVNEIKEGYAHIPRAGDSGFDDPHSRTSIPSAFPDVAITTGGDDQLVIFPSYAKRHVKRDWSLVPEDENPTPTSQGSLRDEEYWRRQWEKDQDEKAIVDVDVRGWVYSPHRGPMTRRNRVLLGLARQLSGIPAPQPPQAAGGNAGHAYHDLSREERRERENIAEKAAEIELKGQEEKRVANQGGYSEPPDGGRWAGEDRYGDLTPRRLSRSPNLAAISAAAEAAAAEAARPEDEAAIRDMNNVELAVANANLMARIAPFLTTPLVNLPVTVFFYNDEQSASRTVQTNDAGQFVMRAPLDFIPTQVRVLVNEKLSATQDVKLIEPYGISLISDIDDTVKRSNISLGAKEIFRNTFVRDLHDLTIDGVREWYNKMHAMGVAFHYCSNSPWQLFPVLASYFMIASLPPGSLHLKQYSGMLQGIFEPVAERKRGTLNRLLRDFPNRQFLLVGDSGEADLEVYTELALEHPGRILAIFIRDVTTPEETGYFDSSFHPGDARPKPVVRDARDAVHSRPSLPPRVAPKPAGPVMGDLIDFSEEPETTRGPHHKGTTTLSQLESLQPPWHTASTGDLLVKRTAPPPRPAKPASLRSAPSTEQLNREGIGLGVDLKRVNSKGVPPPAIPRKPPGGQARSHPLSQTQNTSQQPATSQTSDDDPVQPRLNRSKPLPPPPPPRRREADDYEARQPSSTPSFASSRSSGVSPGGSPPLGGASSQNKKVEVWLRRLQRAHEALAAQGVALYTWRKGEDVIAEAVGLVEDAVRRRRGR